MKTLWSVGKFLGLAFFMAIFSGCSNEKPDIAVATKRYEFGLIKQGEVATAEIAVRNTGKGDLKIESVSTSCGCTSASLEPRVIAPGNEGKLVIRYDSGAHPDSGLVQRHVYIASNDPDETEAEVILMADVQVAGK